DILKIPNAALRVRPPEGTVANVETNAATTNQVAQTNAGARQGGQGNRGGGRRRGGGGGGNASGNGEPQSHHVVYVLPANAGSDAKLQAVQIRTGITDGIFTEVVEGLNEGDQVVTSATVLNSQQPSTGGGNNRMFRRF